jgi:hypothetical protein
MEGFFKEPDFDTIQMLYGFVLLAAAIICALSPNVAILTGVVCMLLIKDGLPNFVVGAKKISERKDKVIPMKKGGVL